MRVDEEEKNNFQSASFSATRTPAITTDAPNQIKATIDMNTNSLLIPPPENLIKKSMVVTEEARTGASIAFEKI